MGPYNDAHARRGTGRLAWPLAALGKVAGIVWPRRWILGIPVATGLALSAVYASALPDVYTATTLVRVREISFGRSAGELPEERSTPVGATVATTLDRILAPGNLRQVVGTALPGASPDDPAALERLRSRITFERQSDYSFRLGLTDSDPERASEALNALLDAFLADEALGPKRRVENERQHYADRLLAATEERNKKAKDLESFAKANAETLLEAREGLVASLERVKGDISHNEQAGRAAQDRLDFLGMELGRPKPAVGTVPSVRKEEKDGLAERRRKLADDLQDARRQLKVERERYADDWPSVRKLIARVNSLEEDVTATDAAIQARSAEPSADAPSPAGPPDEDSEAVQRMKVLRSRTEEQVKQAAERATTLAQERVRIETLLSRVAYTETARKPLTDDLARADARVIELQRQVDRLGALTDYFRRSPASEVTPYRVEQRAAPPREPSGPARTKIVVMGMVAGAGLAYGLLILRKRFHSAVVERAADLADVVGDAMVVSVPYVSAGTLERSRRRPLVREALLCAYACLCVGLAVWAWGSAHGWWPASTTLRSLLGVAR